MNWKYLYIEAGLAVLLILTLGIAGGRGLLSSRMESAVRAEEMADESDNEGGQPGNATGVPVADGITETQETQALIASGQYPIMGISEITVQDMVAYFNDSAKNILPKTWQKAVRNLLRRFVRCMLKRRKRKAFAPRWHLLRR